MNTDKNTKRTTLQAVGSAAGRLVGTIARKLFGGEPRSDRQPCAQCGGQSKYGYSPRAETDPKDIKPMCGRCLVRQLLRDYSEYAGHAVVVQPVPGPPCYVFQPKTFNTWAGPFQIGPDVQSLLKELSGHCGECSQPANFLWVESRGLNGDNFSDVIDKGITETLLAWGNPKPISLCARCCVVRIERALEKDDISYLEVSPPTGEDGFVIPMGY